MNAIELLKKQHREVEDLFEKFDGAKGPQQQAIAETIADKLAVHAAIEEQHFYPATKTARTEDLLREAVEEHLSAKRVIADILDCDPADPQFVAKVKVLKEQIEHHVKEEEGELFPKVQKLFSKDELEDLAVVMQDTAEDLEKGAPRESVPAQTGAPSPID
ncbi:MAG: hemerythrin domain-containing protein [Myxococcales bacterium]